jgi:D-alanyl-D-alanine carboxypeptidase
LRHVKSVVVKNESLYISSVIVLAFLLLVIFVHEPLHREVESRQEPKEEATSPASMFDKGAFQGLTLYARAYIVYDVVGKEVIASSHADERLPLASITKDMTSLTALSLDADKNDIFKIEPSFIEEGYDLGLKKNQTWELDELLKYMLIFSSNDAAIAIASHYGGKGEFVKTMNALSSTYGLTSTFTDPAGRDIGNEIGGIGTVLDAAKLFILAKTTAPDILDATTKKRQSVYPLTGKLTGVPNTNQDIENLPGAEGSKTGYTDLAGGNLGVVVDITVGRPVVIVVLGSTRVGRFQDVEVLYRALEKSLKPFPIKEGE